MQQHFIDKELRSKELAKGKYKMNRVCLAMKITDLIVLYFTPFKIT